MDRNADIIIVGAGCFGVSTAYHLSTRGYKSIRVLDKYEPPSCDAAATDISKVVRSDYNQPLYARPGIESIEAWKKWDLFTGLHHQTGWVLSAMDLSIPFVEGSAETSKRLGVQGLERMTPDQIPRRFPMVRGQLDGWNVNIWNPSTGWAASGEALRCMVRAAQQNGVDFISGNAGWAEEPVYSATGECRGVRTRDGTLHKADVVVLAAGAWTDTLLDLEGQLTAKGHSVAHIQLTPAQQRQYADMPIMDSLELGYYFPPGPDGVFEMAHSNFIINTRPHPLTNSPVSIPHTFVEHPSDDLPLEIRQVMRDNLRRVFPDLAALPFSHTRLCWDADTSDRHFLVTPVPQHPNLFLAAGGSAHGFKFFPVLGKYIADMLEGTLDPEIARQWAWRPGYEPQKRDFAHLYPEVELGDLTGWKGVRKQGRQMEARL